MVLFTHNIVFHLSHAFYWQCWLTAKNVYKQAFFEEDETRKKGAVVMEVIFVINFNVVICKVHLQAKPLRTNEDKNKLKYLCNL